MRRKNQPTTSSSVVIGSARLGICSLLDGCSLGATFEGQRRVHGLEEDEKVLGFRSLEDDPCGYLVDYTWKEKNRWIFEGKEMPFQDFKLYFLRTLHSWSQVLNGGTNLTF